VKTIFTFIYNFAFKYFIKGNKVKKVSDLQIKANTENEIFFLNKYCNLQQCFRFTQICNYSPGFAFYHFRFLATWLLANGTLEMVGRRRGPANCGLVKICFKDEAEGL
jgi:hypothetical protein